MELLYKYLAPTRLDVLAKRQIRFTQPIEFNDPFEMQSIIDQADLTNALEEAANFEEITAQNYSKLPRNLRRIYTLDEYRKKGVNKAQFEALTHSATNFFCAAAERRFFYKGMNKTTGILSLAERKDNLLMWAHYADSHKGYVIGIKKEHTFLAPINEIQKLYKVTYKNKIPITVLSKLAGIEYLVNKGEDWAYEAEWRFIRLLDEAEEKIEQGEYPICLFRFESDWLDSVYIGCKASESTRRDIFKALESQDCKHVCVYQAVINKGRFDLDFEKIQ